jgi:hypothetical protein
MDKLSYQLSAISYQQSKSDWLVFLQPDRQLTFSRRQAGSLREMITTGPDCKKGCCCGKGRKVEKGPKIDGTRQPVELVKTYQVYQGHNHEAPGAEAGVKGPPESV